MDQALGSNDYNDQRSRSRSPSRHGFDQDEPNGRFPGSYSRRSEFRGGRPRGRNGHGGPRGGPRGRSNRSGFRSRGGFGDRRRGGPPMNSSHTQVERNYDNSVFVGNLSFDCTAEDLRDYFAPIGEIVSADIIFRRGRHKGMGTVEFTNTNDVDEAINQLNNTMFMDREIFVKQDLPPPGERFDDERARGRPEFNRYEQGPPPPPPVQLEGYEAFIINLPYSTTWQQLKDIFRQAGNVTRADVELDYNGFSRGFGNVFFPTREEMFRAIDMFNGYELEGRVLEVREGRYNYLLDEQTNFNNNVIDRHRDERGDDRALYDDYPPQEPMHDELRNEIQPSPFTEGVIGGGERNNIVYCSNLPFSTSQVDLFDLFESLGKVENAELKFDSDGNPTGIAVVAYTDVSSADVCINKLNNYNYGGQDLAVSYAQHNNEELA